MSDVVIQVNNLSKQYRLGQIGTGAIAHDINRWWHRVRGKEDPYLKIGEENDRTSVGSSDYVWALRDLSFEVKRGEALGVIGRNGAGKSTLLKILSRTTAPTKGSVKLKGRIASLLEVGTGFHPELSGRENIFLNGAILGMTKSEIKRKFDEIVSFAGVERYIDTPVKRYSSGMYVRLAFGVAAHLESEILIVDEVLAVGDAEFQKKCLGKMGQVTNQEGRTVLFVSHNLSAVETLCTHGIYMKNGGIVYNGSARESITHYLQSEIRNANSFSYETLEEAIGNDKVKIVAGSVHNRHHPDDMINVTSDIDIVVNIVNLGKDPNISIGYDLLDLKGNVIFGSGGPAVCPTGKEVMATCKVPGSFLNDGSYTITVYLHDKNMSLLLLQEDLLSFEVRDTERESAYMGKINGAVRPKLPWEINVL